MATKIPSQQRSKSQAIKTAPISDAMPMTPSSLSDNELEAFSFNLEPSENEFRNIKLKLKASNRSSESEIQAVNALLTMRFLQQPASQNKNQNDQSNQNCYQSSQYPMETDDDGTLNLSLNKTKKLSGGDGKLKTAKRQQQQQQQTVVKQCKSPELANGPSISLSEEQFRVLAEREGIKNVIGEPICKLCNSRFSGPIGIALHTCPALTHQVFKCDICGEDKWKTKANLHSHIKWCKKKSTDIMAEY